MVLRCSAKPASPVAVAELDGSEGRAGRWDPWGGPGWTVASSCSGGPSWPSPALTEPVSPSYRPLEQTMKGELHFEIRKAGALHGFTAWFSVRFQSLEEDEPQLVLSTGPFHP